MHSREHSVLYSRLLSGASLRQVLMDFSVILKIKFTGDVSEHCAHDTRAAKPNLLVWISLTCVCVKSWAYYLYLHLHYYIRLLELALHVHLCLVCQLITSIFMIIPHPLLPLFLTGTLFWPFLKSFCIWRYLFLPLSPLLSDCRKRNRAARWLYHSVDVR